MSEEMNTFLQQCDDGPKPPDFYGKVADVLAKADIYSPSDLNGVNIQKMIKGLKFKARSFLISVLISF